MKKMQLLLVALVVGGIAYLGYRWWEVQRLASQYDEAAEIAKGSISKDGSTWTIHMESVIPEPLDEVWGALKTPERSAELMPETFHRSEIKKDEGNSKQLEFRVQLLSLPAQTMMADLRYDDAAKTMKLTTSGGIQKIDGTYKISAHGGDKTLLVYDATATDQVSLPIPQSAMEGALREFFVMQVRTIKKATGAAPKDGAATQEAKPTGPTAVGSICTGDVGKQGLKQVTMTIADAAGATPIAEAPQKDTGKGYEKTYKIGDVVVREAFDRETRCTTADAIVGPHKLRVESVILSPDSLQPAWVAKIDFAKLAALPADAGELQLRGVFPEADRGWNAVEPLDPPPLESPKVHQAYQQGLF